MKRFIYAGGAVGLTGVLVLLAMAVAQRDARVGDVSTDETKLPYANEKAQPLSPSPSGSLGNDLVQDTWPPAPAVVRGNDSELGSGPATPNFPSQLPGTRAALTSYATSADEGSRAASPLAEPPRIESSSSFPNTLGNSPSGLLPSPSASMPNSLPGSPSNSPFGSAGTSSLPLSPSTSGLSALPSTSLPPTSLPPTGLSANTPIEQDTGRSFENDSSPKSLATLGSPQLPSSPQIPSLSASIPPDTSSQGPGAYSSGLSSNLPSTQSAQTDAASSLQNQMPNAARNGSAAAGTSASLPQFQPSYSQGNAPSYEEKQTAAPKFSALSSAAPGGRQLDGSQNPSLEIQKRAPNEVQVGVPATFTLLVRNVGNATAFDVNVVDAVPKGAKLVRTNPPAMQTGENGLLWKIGEMAARTEQVLTIELIPETEGEIGSVASVNFAVQASVRTVSTQPKLVVKQILDPQILGGETLRIMIDVANVGTGTARDVRLEEDVPQNMRHISGARVLGLTVGDLAPGESEKYDIELTAITSGKVANIVRAVAENAATNESSSQIEVVAPELKTNVEGPRLRYLERQATYTVSVSNTGTAIATNVDLVLRLPSGLQFNSTENQGEYIPSQHAVMWQLAELAAGKTASAKVMLLPIHEGDFVLTMQSQADSVRAESFEKPVKVEGQSELTFTIEDDNDPIETDGRTTYMIKIANVGTRVDNNVELAVDLPEGSVLEQVDAPVAHQEVQRSVVFAPIAQLQPKDQQIIRLAVRHTREGTHVVRARVKSKLREVAVVKEESTQVYRDQ